MQRWRVMFVHILHFKSKNELSWAFRYLASSETVEGCLVDDNPLRIRFVAAPSHASKLIEKLYGRLLVINLYSDWVKGDDACQELCHRTGLGWDLVGEVYRQGASAQVATIRCQK